MCQKMGGEIKYKELRTGDVFTVRLKHYDTTAEFVRMAENSRTMVVVKDIDRGEGWNENRKRYDGVKINKGWYRGANYSYGEEHTVHISQLFELGTAPKREQEGKEEKKSQQPELPLQTEKSDTPDGNEQLKREQTTETVDEKELVLIL